LLTSIASTIRPPAQRGIDWRATMVAEPTNVDPAPVQTVIEGAVATAVLGGE
jgi:hypothetical protein